MTKQQRHFSPIQEQKTYQGYITVPYWTTLHTNELRGALAELGHILAELNRILDELRRILAELRCILAELFCTMLSFID
jgi:hypothetical protein